MAKQIKAIKCPQCSSTKVTLLRDDYYKCNSCGTEFFLDNDDININIRSDNRPAVPANKSQLAVAIIAGLLVLIFLVPLLFKRPTSNTTYTPPFTFDDSDIIPYKNNSNQLEYAIVGLHARTKESDGYELVVRIYNARGKLINETTYDKVYNKSNRVNSSTDIETGKKAIIINEKDAYAFDTGTKKLHYLNDEWTKKPAFAAGIANVKKHDPAYFDIVTLSGIKYRYYAEADNAMAADTAWRYIDNLKVTNPVTQTLYLFCKKSMDEAYKLCRMQQTWQKGYYENYMWWPGIWDYFFGTEREKEELKADLAKKHIKDAVVMTPERSYFGAKVLAWDNKSIFIVYKTNPSLTDDSAIIQSLDKNTGDVQWSYQSPDDNDNFIYTEGIAMNDTEVMITTVRKDVLVLQRANGKVLFKTK